MGLVEIKWEFFSMRRFIIFYQPSVGCAESTEYGNSPTINWLETPLTAILRVCRLLAFFGSLSLVCHNPCLYAVFVRQSDWHLNILVRPHDTSLFVSGKSNFSSIESNLIWTRLTFWPVWEWKMKRGYWTRGIPETKDLSSALNEQGWLRSSCCCCCSGRSSSINNQSL